MKVTRWLASAALVGCSSPAPTSAIDPGQDGGSGVESGAGQSADGGVETGDAATSTSGDSGAATRPDAAVGPGDGGAPEAGPPSPPAAYLTTDDLSQALAKVPITLGDTGSADANVTLDLGTTYQSILGFGASITDSSSYVMTTDLSSAALAALLSKLFDPAAGIGLDFLRQPMGASDFSSNGNFSYDDGVSDPTLAHFNIDQDLKATVPVLKQILALQPGVFIMATPWSPPAWMKNNGSMAGTGGGGSSSGLAGSAYGPFGSYFTKFVQAYAAQGIPIGAVTPENEPLNGTAGYPAMDLNASSELALIAQDIGPSFQQAKLKTLVWAYDHNWDVESYPEQVIGDATAGGFTEGAAFHCYGGDASAMSTFHQHFPAKSVYMTECSGGDWQGDPFANTIDLAIQSTANWARAISLWNMALDENKGPQNAGCSTCRGVVTIDSRSGAVTYNADYFALGHFSKFVRPGAVRVGSSASGVSGVSGVSVSQVAFQNPDGRLAVIAHNTGSSAISLRIGTGAGAMNVGLPANAAVTVSWAQP